MHTGFSGDAYQFASRRHASQKAQWVLLAGGAGEIPTPRGLIFALRLEGDAKALGEVREDAPKKD